MAKTVKTAEVAIIDFTKFDVQQLPEFIGKKEEIKAVIKANPIVEIIDNPTYESAKKSRTAVKTTRTGLEKEKKDVADRIKNNVLGVVNTEYDKLIEDVKKEEALRQEKVTAWETKKEEEHVEKARLEQERIDGIKKSIGEFGDTWEKAFSLIKFENIKECQKTFDESVSVVDASEFQEYEVLFTDKVSYLTNLLNSKIATLTEQEQIRLDNVVLEEKKAEMAKIGQFEKTWNANIDTLKFEDVSPDLKPSLEKDKLTDLKHYQDEFNEKYTSIENRLNAQIEFVSKQESQRLAEEKLEKEKAEFEKKQAEAKLKDRIKQITDLGLIYNEESKGFGLTEKADNLFFDWQISGFDDDNFKMSLDWFKETIENTQEVEFKEEPTQEEKSLKVTGPSVFVGVQYTDENGKKTFLKPTPEVKKEVEEYLKQNDQEDDVHEVAVAKHNQIGKIVSDDWKNFCDKADLVSKQKTEETNYVIRLSTLENICNVELTFDINDFDKFSNLTIKEILVPYFEKEKQE